MTICQPRVTKVRTFRNKQKDECEGLKLQASSFNNITIRNCYIELKNRAIHQRLYYVR